MRVRVYRRAPSDAPLPLRTRRALPRPLARSYALFQKALATIETDGGGLDAFSRGWEKYGFNRATVSVRRGSAEWLKPRRARLCLPRLYLRLHFTSLFTPPLC